jgi:hypothetical protein
MSGTARQWPTQAQCRAQAVRSHERVLTKSVFGLLQVNGVHRGESETRRPQTTNLNAAPSRTMWPAVGAAKWVPMTRIVCSAHSAKRRERVSAAAFGSLSPSDQSGCAIWQGWWAMSPVITARSPGLDHHADMARRVADGRREPDLRRDHVVQLHQLDEAGVEDRLDAIAEHRLLLLVIVGAPEVVLATTDEVARLREGRCPFAVLEHRVPTDVVDVQVRAHHGVDSVARPARLAEVL